VISVTYLQVNRLAEVRNGSGSLISSYNYDPFGRRLWKDVGGTKTYFFYADEGLIGEYDSSGIELKAYGYKPNASFNTDPLFMKIGSDYYFYQNNHLGTPQKMMASNGAVVWSARYTSFGEGDVDISSIISNNLRLPGQYFDEETGLHYNWHRHYDPGIGRYLRADPIGFEGGLNLYVYVLDNPVVYFDPGGLDTWSGNFVEADVAFILFGGKSDSIGYVMNWETGERCRILVRCYKIGVGIIVSGSANSIWIVNGPKCGKDLAGVTIGMGLNVLQPSATVGVASNKSVTITGGGGVGPSGAMYASHCSTEIDYCVNTPKCECRDKMMPFK
jgi:RHS repeat-associated protein